MAALTRLHSCLLPSEKIILLLNPFHVLPCNCRNEDQPEDQEHSPQQRSDIPEKVQPGPTSSQAEGVDDMEEEVVFIHSLKMAQTMNKQVSRSTGG